MRIFVLGPMPPPFGGVSMHMVRYLDLLRAAGLDVAGHPYTGTTKSSRLGRFLQAVGMLSRIYLSVRPGRGDLVHVHYGGLAYFLALGPVLRFSRCRQVVTFHSVRIVQDLAACPPILRGVALRLLNRVDLLVAVRAEIGEELRRSGIAKPALTVMPAFLPPSVEEQALAHLPEDVAGRLVAGQEAGELQVCCGAYYLGPGYGKPDLYGLEAIARVLAALDSRLRRPLVIWMMISNPPASPGEESAEDGIRRIVHGLRNVRLELHYGMPMLPVMIRCCGFLRPSREDGDSVAVREALSLGLPVLASDVVDRPPGVTVFPLAGDTTIMSALEAFLEHLQPKAPGESRQVRPTSTSGYDSFLCEVIGRALPVRRGEAQGGVE